jgi:hypothetical protein
MQADARKAALLRKAMLHLEQADVLVQQALGDTDACYMTHTQIQDLVDELRYDVIEFEEGVE